MSVDVLLVAPLKHELEGILTKLNEPVLFASKRVIGTVVGVGKVASGIAVAKAIITYKPALVVLVGYCGALEETLAIGDIVCASSVVQYDLDLRAFGLDWGSTFLGDGSHAPSFLPLYCPAIEGVKSVVMGTADRFLVRSYREEHPELRENLHLGCSDMEGYAVAFACHTASIPCAIIRVVSDDAKGRRHKQFPVFVREANKKLQETLQLLLESPSEKSPTSL
ncbi:5'-methylthioadenosine/S-adenosylhomocysteine nucleosidase [Sphaerochaeta sp. S2]|uniref:5'-methylthioadenosine/S-adenosylhomocysteine nucleosidase n=1 Tax=Sphaerochaeta sp. S2 TaxID=2798868 RepID=UPI0018E9829D|nr:5'-methylthioadenosine/S-adenosylhomocysteine nucleosidase [Sphaerochaeta sp. S2]MBJ2357902.1 5'-methylthioadenosine/S-adenosylhomocysteine nucleosidase [Sphaerochaeta sp. S2]